MLEALIHAQPRLPDRRARTRVRDGHRGVAAAFGEPRARQEADHEHRGHAARDHPEIGLAEVDSALIRILTAERNTLPPDTASARVAASAPPGATAGSPSDVAHDCVRRCRGGEIKPQLIERPQFTMLDQAVLGPSQTHGLIVVRFVVGVEGAPEPESIRVTTNTVQGLTNQVLDAVRALHFRPATLAGAPVRAEVEMRFEFRASGTNYVDYTITGP